MRRVAAWLVVVLTPAAVGCGTFINLIPEHHKYGRPGPRPLKVYGGVQTDFDFGTETMAKAFQGEQPRSLGPVAKVLGAGYIAGMGAWFLVVDLPLSAVADTLTLPVTIPAAMKNDQADAQTGNRTESGHTAALGSSASAFLIGDTPKMDGHPAEWERYWFGPQQKPQ
jgi:uncharacterized protein YceK